MTLLQLIVGGSLILTGGTLLLIDHIRQQERLTLTAIACVIAGFIVLGATTPTT
ncbi:hypothetical protein ACWGJ9_08040 [Curtobacterium citreum]